MNQRAVPYSVEEAFFNSVFFWFAFVLVFPLITMRLFSEEFKLGTIEPLMTAPVRDWQVVLSKYFGALFFYIILWIPTVLYFVIFQAITHQPAAGSTGAYLGGYLMLLLARDVLSLDRLFRLGPDEKPDRRRDHFLRHDHAPFLSRARLVHPPRCQLGDAAACSAISPPSSRWARFPAE